MTKDVITFGCRLNAYESEVIRGHLEAYDDAQPVTVFNTCAVTKEAERQAKQAIRRYARKHPNTKIIVTGCAAQITPEAYSTLPGVDRVLGNSEKLEKHQYSLSDAHEHEPVRVNDIMEVRETASHLVNGFEGHSRAFLQVQNGCNHRCTFCIIPYGRGNSRSVPIGEIVKQAQLLLDQGYNELVLTGVDISDYGKDLPGSPSLGQMVKRLLKLVPVPRLRLSSIDVAEIDDTLLQLLMTETRLMPHIHLSLQAGDNMILKRMKRRHTREQAIDFCHTIRAARPEVVFGADVITGFPTETDEMFQQSLNIVEEAGLTWLHVFPYSEREGTPAALIPADKQVPIPLRKERAEQLRQAGEKQIQALFTTRAGKQENIVVESGQWGRTEQFAKVKLCHDYPEGSIQTIHTDGREKDYLLEAV